MEAAFAVQPHVVLPLLTAILAAITAVAVFDQWVRRRRPYQVVWALGLTWYALAAAAEFLGGANGWTESLRAWYLFGAFGVAAWLGLGTVFLLRRTRFGYVVAVAILLSGLITLAGGSPIPLAVAAAGAVAIALATWRRRELVAPVAGALLVGGSAAVAWLVLNASIAPPGFAIDTTTLVPIGTAFPESIRALSPLFNLPGAVALVGGALFSAYIFTPRRVLRGRAPPRHRRHRSRASAVVNFAAHPSGRHRCLATEAHSRCRPPAHCPGRSFRASPAA
jgi:hypothetical protein